jgi:hypothetical protein
VTIISRRVWMPGGSWKVLHTTWLLSLLRNFRRDVGVSLASKTETTGTLRIRRSNDMHSLMSASTSLSFGTVPPNPR